MQILIVIQVLLLIAGLGILFGIIDNPLVIGIVFVLNSINVCAILIKQKREKGHKK